MQAYEDAILYFPSYSAFIREAKRLAPRLITNGNEINAYARTPAVMKEDELMVYVRITKAQKQFLESFVQMTTETFAQLTVPETYTVKEFRLIKDEVVEEEKDEYPFPEQEKPQTRTYYKKVETEYPYPPEAVGKPIVEVLARAPSSHEAPDTVYGNLFANPDAKSKYDRVYDTTPIEEVDEETGETIIIEKPERFGVLAI